MKKSIFYRLIAFMLVCLVLFTTSPVFAVKAIVAIGETDNGRTITLYKGQVLQLSLITNPSTGYSWQYVQQPDPRVLSQISHFIKPMGTAPGSPSMEYWVYQPIGYGSTVISLKYCRSWLPNDPPVKTFMVNIIVK